MKFQHAYGDASNNTFFFIYKEMIKCPTILLSFFSFLFLQTIDMLGGY